MKVLLVVDIDYYDHWRPEIVQENASKKKVALSLQNKLNDARKSGELIVFVTLHLQYSGQEMQLSKNGQCIGCDGVHENKLAEFLQHRHDDEPIFCKNTADAFYNANLGKYLKLKGVTELLLAGGSTFECIQATAEGALQQGFHVKLLRECIYPPFYNNDEQYWLKMVEPYKPSNDVSVEII